MGNSASDAGHFDESETDGVDPFDGIDTLGYRVLGVQPDSPAAEAGLVSFLDFLVGANGQLLLGSGEGLEDGEEYDDVDLPALLQDHQDKEVELLVWNIKSQESRLVYLSPREGWGGAGLLGVTIRLDNYAGAEDRLIRVLDVQPQSPAAIAGLVANQDFILGTTHETLETVNDLADLLHDMVDKVIEFYVYNVDSDVVRVVALMPTLSWGGPGLLGAELGVGYLHRLPHASRNTQGASITRKVRYVSGNGVPPKQPPPASGNSSRPPAAASAPSSKPLLEVEPQLEMEAHDDDESSVEEVTIPLRQQSQQTPRQSRVSPSRNGNSATLDRPPIPPAKSYSSSSMDAADVFARSPVQPESGTVPVQPQYATAMPPPPKMHY